MTKELLSYVKTNPLRSTEIVKYQDQNSQNTTGQKMVPTIRNIFQDLTLGDHVVMLSGSTKHETTDTHKMIKTIQNIYLDVSACLQRYNYKDTFSMATKTQDDHKQTEGQFQLLGLQRYRK